MRFHHVGQAGLELLTSDDRPALASQSGEITGMHHHPRPKTSILLIYLFKYFYFPFFPQFVLSPKTIILNESGQYLVIIKNGRKTAQFKRLV